MTTFEQAFYGYVPLYTILGRVNGNTFYSILEIQS